MGGGSFPSKKRGGVVFFGALLRGECGGGASSSFFVKKTPRRAFFCGEREIFVGRRKDAVCVLGGVPCFFKKGVECMQCFKGSFFVAK